MKKQKILLIITMVILSVFGITLGVLYALNILDLLLFSIFIAVDVALLIANVVLFILVLKKIKKAKLIKNKELSNTTGNYIQDLYGAIGIPLQYNKDGSIKDIYELLGIEPLYDEYGNRILTPYELLAMLPKFNEKGEEIPSVFAIKNRVGRVAKVDLSQRVLTRKLSDQEKEELLIRETLQKKLDEAVQSGDKQKEQAIKKVIVATTSNKPEQKKPSSKKPISYKSAKGGYKPVGLNISGSKASNKDDIFSRVFKPSKNNNKNDLNIDIPVIISGLVQKIPNEKKQPPVIEKPLEKPQDQDKVQLPVNAIAIVPGSIGGKPKSKPVELAIIENKKQNNNDFQPEM